MLKIDALVVPRRPPSIVPMPNLPRSPLSFLSLALVAASLAGCGKGPAYGSDNAIIAVVDPALDESLMPAIRAMFEREVFTTRSEPLFEVTFTTPAEIGAFRQWKRLLVIEPLEDAVLVPELVDVPDSGPVVAEAHDAWALNQTIWVLAGETPAATEALATARLDSLFQTVYQQYVAHQLERMWVSGRDSASAARLRDSLGFSILLPRVYRPAPGSAPPDSRVWYNQTPRRVVSIHWLPRPAELTAGALLAARRAWGREAFPADTLLAALSDTVPGTTGTGTGRTRVDVSEARLDGQPAIRLQGIWRDRDDASAGVFLTYGVLCGEHLVVLDGNLYAPDRSKVPYLFQLERIMETFRCRSAA